MAIGIGQMLGVDVPENFNQPYQAKSISDFWKRWHISLSMWFRDYIYIPLGGNRCSVFRHIFNLGVVWMLTGIWHGADWSFIAWGLGYFLLLIFEKYLPCMKKVDKHWWGHIYTLFCINILWIFFRADNLFVACKYISGMFGINVSGKIIEEKTICFIPLLAVIVCLCFPWQQWVKKHIPNSAVEIIRKAILIILVGFAVCAIINSSYMPYIYGNF